MNVTGKTALVTGGGRGIGLGCALELARAGASIVLNDRPGSPDLAHAVGQITSLGGVCTAVEQDAHSRAGCEALLDAALRVAPRIDILIGNPAVSIRNAFLDFVPADFDAVIAGTLTAQFHLAQLVTRSMVERRRDPHDGCQGKIVFISSVHGEMPYAKSVAYNAAKAGLNHMALTIAAELACERINVNVIEPGWIDTPGERKHFGLDAMRAVGPTLPWGRLGTPADIGRATTFLSSDDADYITGSILRVDGGFVLKDCRGDSIRRL
jgi:glucose 1-dehydrogenase